MRSKLFNKLRTISRAFGSQPTNRHAIIFGIDKNYTMPLAVCVRSLLENSRGDSIKDIYILHSELDPGQKKPVHESLAGLKNFELHWIPVDTQLFSQLSPGLPHVSRATYFRFLAPSLLPSSVDTALYLDSDTVVLDDIDKLFSLSDPAWPLQACRDYVGYFDTPILGLNRLADFGIDPKAAYYNSGVLLINMKAWRSQNLAKKILDFAAANPDCLTISDQNSINIVLHGQIGALPDVWNTQAIYPKLLDGSWNFPYIPQPAIEQARIYHYTSELKPWSGGRDFAAAKLFHDFHSRTAWAPAKP
ncbi:MAG: glycosyltransferase family 8 protein [Bdellovibrionota bacterium]